MSEQPGQDRQVAEERVDFGEYFEKSAQILANEPAQDFEMPMTMGVDFQPPTPSSADEG